MPTSFVMACGKPGLGSRVLTPGELGTTAPLALPSMKEVLIKAVHESGSHWVTHMSNPWETWLGFVWFVSHGSESTCDFLASDLWLEAGGTGVSGRMGGCPSMVEIWLPVMENWPSWWPSRGAAKRSHHANFRNKIIENHHEMCLNYSSNLPVRTSNLECEQHVLPIFLYLVIRNGCYYRRIKAIVYSSNSPVRTFILDYQTWRYWQNMFCSHNKRCFAYISEFSNPNWMFLPANWSYRL